MPSIPKSSPAPALIGLLLSCLGSLLAAGGEGMAELPQGLSLSPTFNCCSYYYVFAKGEEPGEAPQYEVEFKAAGMDCPWRKALAPVMDRRKRNIRGSVVGLQEGTPYELRISMGGRTLVEGGFTTFSSAAQIAQTVDLTAMKEGLKIRAKGSSDGWIKYVAPPGAVVEGDSDSQEDGIEIDGAEYVILEGIVLRGGKRHGISVRNSRHVRIVNCDIAAWGREGKRGQDPDIHYDEKGSLVHGDSGIYAVDSVATLVERCFIHDPRSKSSGWRYGHPIGANPLRVGRLRQTVARYNDFVGLDSRRWNDGIESEGNTVAEGGFQRDADIHGNFLAFAHDDGVELDGGQMNVRFYENRLEGGYCGVSTTTCVEGPSYVFRNLIAGMGDADGAAGLALKDLKPAGDGIFYFNNTICWSGSGIRAQTGPRRLCNNVICCSWGSPCSIQEGNPNAKSIVNNLFWLWPEGKSGVDLPSNFYVKPEFENAAQGMFALKSGFAEAWSGLPISNFMEGRSYLGALEPGGDSQSPARPAAFVIDRNTIRFPAEAKNPEDFSVKVEARAVSPGFSGFLEARQSDGADWFEVEPRRADVKAGSGAAFNVTLKPERMARTGLHSGAFIIRQENGFSRPVSVYAIKRGDATAISYPEEAIAIPANPDAPDAGLSLAPGSSQTYRFTLPSAGKRYILLECFAEYPAYLHNDLEASLDGGPLKSNKLPLTAGKWSWAGLALGLRPQKHSWIASRTELFQLEAGEHSILLKGVDPVRIRRILITPSFTWADGNADNFQYPAFE